MRRLGESGTGHEQWQRHVQDPFTALIGVAAGDHHANGGNEIGDGCEEADGEVRQAED
jgi:hypothetical protein